MNNMRKVAYWVAIGIAVIPMVAAKSQDGRPFSVKDDIAMVRFSDPRPEHRIPGSEIVRPSPDGKHYALVTTKGLLDSDQVDSEISVFEYKGISDYLHTATGRQPAPRVIASIVSYPHRDMAIAYAPVIEDLHWSSDSTSVYFKGEGAEGEYRLYFAKVDGSGFGPLTPAGESVCRFDAGHGVVVYTASRSGENHLAQLKPINADAFAVDGHRLRDVLFPDQFEGLGSETCTMSILRFTNGSWSTRPVSEYSVQNLPYLSYFYPFTLSPKGDQVIGLAPVSAVPESWTAYDPIPGYEFLRYRGGQVQRTDAQSPQRYSLIDVATGKVVPLVDGPNARSLGYVDKNLVTWTADARRVLITNTFLGLDERTTTDASQRNRPCAVASVDLPSLNARCLLLEAMTSKSDETHVQDVSFGKNNDEAEVLVKRGPGKRAIQRYELRNGTWILTSASPINTETDRLLDLDVERSEPAGRTTLFVSQGLNDPPTLWVSDSVTGRRRQLWNPNPEFNHLRFGNASTYSWKDETGYVWAGELVKPVDYVPGKRYPLVIQMYQFFDDEFLTDGMEPTAFAARHLASEGFFVLQVRKKPDTLSEADPQAHLEGYRSAIENLVDAGFVDRSRVGVVGFSFTCWYVVNALVKEPRLFAAATIADGLDYSYMQYLLVEGNTSLQRQLEQVRGTSPFGNGLRRWLEDSPEFHLDQVQTPVRIEAINPESVLQEWELYSSLRMQNKPVDLIYFPRGTHIHQKPLERLESQQGDVDWFRFWLQGYEDPDPQKRAQYERWHALRNEKRNDPAMANGR